MNEKSNENVDTPLNVSNSDNEQTPLANQDTNSPESSNFNNPSRENALIGEKISNLDFLVCSNPSKNDDDKNEVTSKCSPDNNLSSNTSCSGNEDDDNVEYKLIEKNLNNSLLNEEKFNLFFKKSLIDENLSQTQKDSFKTDENIDGDDQFETLKSVLLNEEIPESEAKQYIVDDDFEDRFYNKLNTCSNSHDDDFIDEDIVPLNIKPQVSKKCIVNEIQEDQGDSPPADSNNIQINTKDLTCTEGSAQVICYNLSLSDDDDNEKRIVEDTDSDKKKANEVTCSELELKVESKSSIEENDLSKNSKSCECLNEADLKATDKPINKAAFIWSGKNRNYKFFFIHNFIVYNDVFSISRIETEAIIQQHEQTSASACGATAILNILKALNFNYDETTVCSKVKVNSRIPEALASSTNLTQYLYSRSIAGMNSMELIENIENATQNKITGRFFSFYPQRDIDLTQWLIYWIQKGF